MKRFQLAGVVKVLMAAMVISLMAGCVTNPETGRRQLLLVSEGEMSQLGLSSFNQM